MERKAITGAGGALKTLRKEKRRGGLFLTAFGLLFSSFGLLFTWMISADVWLKAANMDQRVETEATVVASDIRVSRSSDSTTHTPEIRFRYSWDGTELYSDTWSIIDSGGRRDWARSVVATYPVGSEHLAWVDPENPRDAILDRTLGKRFALTFIPLIFVLVGAIIAGFGIRILRRADETGSKRHGDTLPDAVLRDARILGLPTREAKDVGKSCVLKPDKHPVGNFLAGAAFVIIWNAFSWFMLSLARQEGGTGPVLFVSLFVVIGAILILVFIHRVLGLLLGPKVRLFASSDTVHPGGKIELNWQIQGTLQSIKDFQINLEGATEASYTVGSGKQSRRVTDRSTFLREPLQGLHENMPDHSGQGVFQFPSLMPPTFKAGSNAIRYTIQVKGKVTFLPNIAETYDIYVIPATSSPQARKSPQ